MESIKNTEMDIYKPVCAESIFYLSASVCHHLQQARLFLPATPRCPAERLYTEVVYSS